MAHQSTAYCRLPRKKGAELSDLTLQGGSPPVTLVPLQRQADDGRPESCDAARRADEKDIGFFSYQRSPAAMAVTRALKSSSTYYLCSRASSASSSIIRTNSVVISN